MLENLKEQLNREKDGKMKYFGYGSIMISFVLERIPLLRPQHIALELPSPRVPQMRKWVDLMSHHASASSISFTPTLF